MKLPGRSGTYTAFRDGGRAFIPKRLPPDPAVEISPEMQMALSRADRALARLDGATMILPNPDRFVFSFMRQEAVLSSQIEGTQASLDEVLEYEARPGGPKKDDITDVINYINAMNWGLDELSRLPVCLRLVKGLHARLLSGGRGSDKNPGEFRMGQNWIGDPGCTIQEATFVPPPVPEMHRALSEWERFIHASADTPPLIKCALIHAQFETIHPFLDGNGRLGRMIITFYLCSEEILSKPILYLSLFFKNNREDYYRLLQAIRDDGNWEDWILFFLRGVHVTSKSALGAARAIIDLREQLMAQVQRELKSNNAPLLLDLLFERPYVTVSGVAKLLDVSYPTAKSLVESFAERNMLVSADDRRRDRIFAFTPYLEILQTTTTELTDGAEDGGRR